MADPTNDFTRIKSIVVAACDLQGEARAAYLDEACGNAAGLRLEVESLLAQQTTDQAEDAEGRLLREVQGIAADVFAETVPDVFAGRYRVERFLAEGGMGRVYQVHDLELGVDVALKTIHPRVAADPLYLRLFKHEVLLARSVSHPSVCRIFDISRDNPTGIAFLTMEFLQGDTLAAAIAQDGPLAVERASALAEQMAGALDAAHRAGIIHRDFKSANVMLVPTADGERAVITDFGLAVAVDDELRGRPSADGHAPEGIAATSDAASRASTAHDPLGSVLPKASADPRSGRIAGTPAYMSPEQVQGEALGPASDLYSFGVVLFEMCTAQLPFRGSTPQLTADARLTQDPPRPSALAKVDTGWEDTILRLLARTPGERFASAHEAVTALRGGIESTPQVLHSLPAERDAFVGRADELHSLERILEGDDPQVRLLSVLGAGGTGKSRLVRKYGWERLAHWPGGVWFCDLSDCRGILGVASAVASALDVTLGNADPVVQLGSAIALRGQALIVLDNFEQIVEHAEATIGQWLVAAPQSRFLITSRQRLRLPEERALELGPLDLQSEGIELFTERVQSHRPGFAVDEDNRSQVVEILEHLDGIPLAIELAAARLRMLSLDDLNTRLVDRFRVLSGGKGRHATLRKTLDWSWELLEPLEQSVLNQVAVFEGGFRLGAAEDVVDHPEDDDDLLVIDVLQSLVDKSWIRVSAVAGVPRFSLFGTVQAYVCAQRNDDEEQTHAVSRRHARYFARMGTPKALERLDRQGSPELRTALRAELDNIIAACRFALGQHDEEIAVPAFFAAEAILRSSGPYALATQLGSEVLAATKDPARRAKLLMQLALLAYRCGDPEDSQRKLEEAQGYYQQLGDRKSETRVVGSIAMLLRVTGKVDEARDMSEQALVGYRACGDQRGEALVLGELGHYHNEKGRLEEAAEHYATALKAFSGIGDRVNEGHMLANLAGTSSRLGRVDASRRNYDAALAAYREIGHRAGEATALLGVASLEFAQGRFDDARVLYEASLSICRMLGFRSVEGAVLGNLGSMLREQGKFVEARQHLSSALAIHRDISLRRHEGFVLGQIGALDLAEGDLESSEEHIEQALAIHRELGERMDEGVVMGFLSDLRRLQGRHDDARRCVAEGLSLSRALRKPAMIASLLCQGGELALEAGDVSAAQSAWAEADEIASSLSLEPEAVLARSIAKLRQALPQSAS